MAVGQRIIVSENERRRKCKNPITKTASKNASIRAKNKDEKPFFILSCCRFSLFSGSKHSFCMVKAALLHAKSYAFAWS
ncbi:hypothetical protein C3V39_05150 [Prevotella sp. oral taxon 820]|nr:hypothetical protein C3V39_05150 [Prevotella sp. oral taxon 820]